MCITSPAAMTTPYQVEVKIEKVEENTETYVQSPRIKTQIKSEVVSSELNEKTGSPSCSFSHPEPTTPKQLLVPAVSESEDAERQSPVGTANQPRSFQLQNPTFSDSEDESESPQPVFSPDDQQTSSNASSAELKSQSDKNAKPKKESKRRHVCNVCSKTFGKPSNLKQHMVVHSGRRDFVCDVCSKSFVSTYHLKQHKLFHSGQKDFVCDVCNKAFTLAFQLKQHQRFHTGQKNFVCDICDKAFVMSSCLKRHMLVHTGQKDFVCDICKKAFALAVRLKEHKLTHSGSRQKDFLCDVCSKAFTQVGSLNRHKLIHTGQKDFVCDICHKAFTLRGNLQKHQVTHSKQKNP